MKCPNCNEIYSDRYKFCPYCGTEKPSPKICPNCGLELNIEFSFCPECGVELISGKNTPGNGGKLSKQELMDFIDREYNFLIINFGFSVFTLIRRKIDSGEITSIEEIYHEATILKKEFENKGRIELETYLGKNYGPYYLLIIDKIRNGEITSIEEIDCEVKKLEEKRKKQEEENKRKQERVRRNEGFRNAQPTRGWTFKIKDD